MRFVVRILSELFLSFTLCYSVSWCVLLNSFVALERNHRSERLIMNAKELLYRSLDDEEIPRTRIKGENYVAEITMPMITKISVTDL